MGGQLEWWSASRELREGEVGSMEVSREGCSRPVEGLKERNKVYERTTGAVLAASGEAIGTYQSL